MKLSVGFLCLAVATTLVSSSFCDAFNIIQATRAIAPGNGNKKKISNLATDIGKKRSVVKVPDIAAAKKKKPVVVNKKKKDVSAKKKKPVVVKKKDISAKKKKPVVIKKKVVAAKKVVKKKKVISVKNAKPQFVDPSLALTKKFVQQKKKKNPFSLKKKAAKPSASKTVTVEKKEKEAPRFTLPSLPKTGGDVKEKKNNDTNNSKKIKVIDYGSVINPIDFGLRVVNSDKGKEAASILIDGGLKFVSAVLEEGKKSKVEVSRGYDPGTGLLKKTKVVNIGLKELLDVSTYAGSEFLGVAKNTYERFYVGGEGLNNSKVTRIPAKIDKKTKKVLVPITETYFVTIGGKRTKITQKF